MPKGIYDRKKIRVEKKPIKQDREYICFVGIHASNDCEAICIAHNLSASLNSPVRVERATGENENSVSVLPDGSVEAKVFAAS